MRNMILTNLAFGLLGALLALLVGWPFNFAGGGFWWALWGAGIGLVVGFVIVQMMLDCGWFSDHPAYTPQINCMIMLALLLLSGPVLAADRIARQGNDWVRLNEKACANEAVRARLLPDGLDDWHAASAMFQGQPFEGCWREVRGGFYIVYEDGDRGFVPASELKPVSTI